MSKRLNQNNRKIASNMPPYRNYVLCQRESVSTRNHFKTCSWDKYVKKMCIEHGTGICLNKESLQQLQKYCNSRQLSKHQYLHATLDLHQSKKSIFLFFQSYKSSQFCYGYIIQDKVDIFETSIKRLLITSWKRIKNSQDIEQIINYIKSKSHFKHNNKKKLTIPSEIVYNDKHLLNRDKYHKISLLNPRKIAILIHGYLNQFSFKIYIPDDIGKMVYEYYGLPEKQKGALYNVEYMENGNIVVDGDITFPASLRLNEIYMVKICISSINSMYTYGRGYCVNRYIG